MPQNWGDLQVLWIDWISGAGILLNFLLLYLIKTDRHKAGDGYRRILMIISWYNIFYALVHWIVGVAILVDEAGYIAFSSRFARHSFWASYAGIQVFIASFIMSLSLLAAHCLYRYVKISGRFTLIFERWYCILLLIVCNLLFAALVIVFSSLTVMPSQARDQISQFELMERYNLSIVNLGYIGPVYRTMNSQTGQWDYRWKDLIGIIGCHSLQVITYIAICTCGLKLYFFLHRSLISPKAKAINLQLMRLLLIEAITPLFFDYIPCFVAMWGGLLGLPMSEAAFYVPILFSCYPAAEALMTTLGFRAYRRRVFGLWTPATYSETHSWVA
ncbi:unnamed protein product, partial [Mesorhabditis belari]|uniref:Uncharacterized protein n=1 Tax=Mesorhabditis belari TaxID=2138241 RepID=A0AAF3ESM2_9BILA